MAVDMVAKTFVFYKRASANEAVPNKAPTVRTWFQVVHFDNQ